MASKFQNISIGNFKTSCSCESSYHGKYLQVLKKEILIQPPGEPQEQHLGDVRPKNFELHKVS